MTQSQSQSALEEEQWQQSVRQSWPDGMVGRWRTAWLKFSSQSAAAGWSCRYMSVRGKRRLTQRNATQR